MTPPKISNPEQRPLLPNAPSYSTDDGQVNGSTTNTRARNSKPKFFDRAKLKLANIITSPFAPGVAKAFAKHGTAGAAGIGLGAGGYALVEHVIIPAIHAASGKSVSLPIWAAVLVSAAAVFASVVLAIVIWKGASALIRVARSYKEEHKDAEAIAQAFAIKKAIKKAGGFDQSTGGYTDAGLEIRKKMWKNLPTDSESAAFIDDIILSEY